jgi:hypothetical protein
MSTRDPDSQEKTPSSGTEAKATRNNTDPERHIEADGEPDEPPDGGYGWVVVVAIIFMTAATWGLSARLQKTARSLLTLTGFNTSFGVYLAHFEDNSTFPGATPLKYSLVGSLSVAVALLCAPLANILTKTFGHRVPMLFGKQCLSTRLWTQLKVFTGMVACSLGQCMAGLCRSFGAYIACQGLIFGIGMDTKITLL